MDAEALLNKIRHSPSPLVAPRPLNHSLELADGLPAKRRHLGPRPWYEALEELASRRDPDQRP